jgi:lysozyme
MTTLRGKVSWFGGPDDTGVAPDEGLAFIYEVDDAPQLFLSTQPPGTTGLARRLDPACSYIATRWDYDIYPKDMLPGMQVLIRALKTGRSKLCTPADWGPHVDTGRVADISPGLMEALGIETDDDVEIIFPYQGVQPMTAPICIDISHHQGYCDFDEVAKAGVLGMIHKATEGTSFVDDMRAENCSRALDAGLAISTYHWLSPGSDPADQMDFYLSTIKPSPGERVVIDYEQDGCTISQLEKAVQTLMDHGSGLKITVYSGHLLKEQLGNSCNSFLQTNTDLWLAQYTSSEENISWSEGTYEEWKLWQYKDTGTLPGIDDAYVDFNNFNGTAEEFLKWISPDGARPPIPVPPHPGDKLVSIVIDTPEGVAVDVTVNGVLTHHRPKRRRRRIKRGPDIIERIKQGLIDRILK